MDKERAIARIKKCLALSKSPNEHEAAAALRQAQKLMASHGISEEDVDESAVISDFVDHDDYGYAGRKPLVIIAVTKLMRKAFGVETVWECSPSRKHRVRYFGTQSGVTLATYSHVVVYRAANAAWRKYLKERPNLKGVRNARASFVLGWCSAVSDKVAVLNATPEVAQRIERKKLEHYGPTGLSDSTAGSRTVYSGVHGDGAARGEEFDINRPVGTDRRYLEHSS